MSFCDYIISDTLLPKAKHTLCSTIFNEFSEDFCSTGKIEYTSNRDWKGNAISKMETGIVDLPGYSNNENCNGGITVAAGSRILLKFESFEVRCNWENLIYAKNFYLL